MFKQIKIGKLFGIPIQIEAIALVVWLLIYSQIGSSIFVIYLFSTLLHEFGHTSIAKFYNHKIQSIVFTIWGAEARISSFLDRPKEEFWIALAGPMVNVCLATLFFIVSFYYKDPLITQVMIVNVIIGIFNLLPMLPMDGGLILRSLLSMRYSHLYATKISFYVCLFLGISLSITAFIYQLYILAIMGLIIPEMGYKTYKQAKLYSDV